MNQTDEISPPLQQPSQDNAQNSQRPHMPPVTLTPIHVTASVEQSSLSIWLPITLSFLSVLIATSALWYSKEQTGTAKDTLIAAIEQLRLAKEAQSTAEKNYLVAKEQLELQRSAQQEDNKFPVVYDASFLDALRGPLHNKQLVQVAFVNRTKRAQSYRVSVETTNGVGVYFENIAPEKLIPYIYLDSNPIVVPPDGEYRRSFVVWHSTKPIPRATLRLNINGRPDIERQYEYNSQLAAYVPLGS